jgi:membrane protein YdbS with pleckstrin-like domain
MNKLLLMVVLDLSLCLIVVLCGLAAIWCGSQAEWVMCGAFAVSAVALEFTEWAYHREVVAAFRSASYPREQACR